MLKFGVQLAIAIFFSHRLSLEEYGDYQFIWMFVNFFSLISLFGLSNYLLSTSIAQLLAIIKKFKKKIVIVLSLVNIAAILFVYLSNNNLSGGEKILLVCLLLLQNISLAIDAIAIKNQEEKRLATATLLYLIIFIAGHMWFYFNQHDFLVLLIFIIVATILKAVFLFPKKTAYPAVANYSSETAQQWLYLGLNELFATLVKWVDKWILIFFLSGAQFAIYFNGSYEIPIFVLAVSAIGNVALVEFSNKEKNMRANAIIFYKRIALFMAVWVFPSFWFFQQFGSEFIAALFGEKYLLSIPIFLVTIWILPVRIIYNTAVLQALGKSQLILKGSIIDLLVALVLMVIFYQSWDLKGVALAFVIATYVQVAYYLFHTSRLLKIRIQKLLPFKKLAFVFLISAVAIHALSYFASAQSEMFRLIVGIVGTGVLIGVLLIFVRFGRRVRLRQPGTAA